ncbi:MAG: methyltransferase domain-containing protein [Verrucomicrobiae bacterium]|nr:methyltransferase domain-containing protein [Verrucomicrobiae bacterium]
MKTDYAHDYAGYEQSHWWFKARRRLLKGFLDQHITWRPGLKALEIGVGPGENLKSLYPLNIDLVGLEPNSENATLAQQRSGVNVYTGALGDLPRPVSEKKYDLVCLFDVLEHIEDDTAAIKQIWDLLGIGGQVALTTPAFQWLWGPQDLVNQHYRRYTRHALCRKLEQRDFKIMRKTYFNTLLFPPIAAFRLLTKYRLKTQPDAISEFTYSAGPFNQWLEAVFSAEWPILKYVDFPVGISIFILARKTEYEKEG